MRRHRDTTVARAIVIAVAVAAAVVLGRHLTRDGGILVGILIVVAAELVLFTRRR